MLPCYHVSMYRNDTLVEYASCTTKAECKAQFDEYVDLAQMYLEDEIDFVPTYDVYVQDYYLDYIEHWSNVA